MNRTPFTENKERSKELLGLIYIDVYGSMMIHFIGKYTYFIIFIDDHYRCGYVYLIKHKFESFKRFRELRNKIEKQTGKSLKIFQSDQGEEYSSHIFQDYLKNNRILLQWKPPRTTQLYGVSEMRNCTLLDMVRYMMSYTNLPCSF
jgi:transposase InsO family protein